MDVIIKCKACGGLHKAGGECVEKSESTGISSDFGGNPESTDMKVVIEANSEEGDPVDDDLEDEDSGMSKGANSVVDPGDSVVLPSGIPVDDVEKAGAALNAGDVPAGDEEDISEGTNGGEEQDDDGEKKASLVSAGPNISKAEEDVPEADDAPRPNLAAWLRKADDDDEVDPDADPNAEFQEESAADEEYEASYANLVVPWFKAPLTKSGGPFIGPHGGKWADPDHKIPWDEKKHSGKPAPKAKDHNPVDADNLHMISEHNVRKIPHISDYHRAGEETRGEHHLAQQKEAIQKNLANKMASGKYDHAQATKLWHYHAKAVDAHAKKHNLGGGADPSTRMAAAKMMADQFADEAKAGEHDDKLNGKHSKKLAKHKVENPKGSAYSLGDVGGEKKKDAEQKSKLADAASKLAKDGPQGGWPSPNHERDAHKFAEDSHRAAWQAHTALGNTAHADAHSDALQRHMQEALMPSTARTAPKGQPASGESTKSSKHSIGDAVTVDGKPGKVTHVRHDPQEGDHKVKVDFGDGGSPKYWNEGTVQPGAPAKKSLVVTDSGRRAPVKDLRKGGLAAWLQKAQGSIPGASDTSRGKDPADGLPTEEQSITPSKRVNGAMDDLDGEDGGNAGVGAYPAAAGIPETAGQGSLGAGGKEERLSDDDPAGVGAFPSGEPGPEEQASAMASNGLQAGKGGVETGGSMKGPGGSGGGDIGQGAGSPSFATGAFPSSPGIVPSPGLSKSRGPLPDDADVLAEYALLKARHAAMNATDDVYLPPRPGQRSAPQAPQQAPQAQTFRKGMVEYSNAADMLSADLAKGDGFFQEGSPTIESLGAVHKSVCCSLCKSEAPAYLSACPSCGGNLAAGSLHKAVQLATPNNVPMRTLRLKRERDLVLPDGLPKEE